MNVYVSLKFICWNLIRNVVGLVSYKRGLESSLLPSTILGHREKTAVYMWEGGLLSDTGIAGALILDFPASKNVRNKCWVFGVYKSPSLWHFGILPLPIPSSKIFKSWCTHRRFFIRWRLSFEGPEGPKSILTSSVRSRAVVPNIFDTRDLFHGRRSFCRPESGGWFRSDSSALPLLCTLFLLLLHEFQFRLPSIIKH